MDLCHLEQRDRCWITRRALRESVCLLHPASVSIRQHTSAYVSIRQHTPAYVVCALLRPCRHTDCAVSVPYLTIRYVRRRQHTRSADCAVSLPSVSIRQHPSAYVSIRQHTSWLWGVPALKSDGVACVNILVKSVVKSVVECMPALKSDGVACVNTSRSEVVGSKVSSKVSSKVHACVEERWRSVCEHLARHEVVRLKRSWHVVRACVSRLLR